MNLFGSSFLLFILKWSAGKGFLPLPKRQIKYPVASYVGATADMMRQRYRIKLSLEDICDSQFKKVGKCQERR